MLRKSLCIFLCLFLTICIVVVFLQKKPLSNYQNLHKIPKKDQILLEAFLRALIFEEDGAYVLLGDKPLAITGYFDNCEEDEVLPMFFRNYWKLNWMLRRGYETWEKYQHLFFSKKFILKAIKTPNNNLVVISLINREAFSRKVNQHLDDFRTILGTTFDPFELLEKHLKEDREIFEVIKCHEGLFGILLGYGRNNAWLFHERARTYYDPYTFTLSINPRPAKPFQSIQEERAFYAKKLQRFPPSKKLRSLSFLTLPYFLADLESDETKDLYQKYCKERQAVLKAYSGGDFLKVTLKKLEG